MQDGDLVWTRDRGGAFWLGKVTGKWRYDTSHGAERFDLNNVRDCTWLTRSLRDFDVPGAVVRAFMGPGQTLRQIPNPVAAEFASMIWERAADPTATWPKRRPKDVLTGLLDPTDVEDLVLIWLQTQGWILLPSSRQKSTPVYEAVLTRQDGSRAVVAVKSGSTATVPIADLAQAADTPGTTAYAFSTEGLYSERPDSHGVVEIQTCELTEFMGSKDAVLPPRIRTWLTGDPP